MNNIENKIYNDEEFKKGLSFGKPRPGHPEGQVMYHIEEVLENVEKYCDDDNREALRLIAIIHDSFKHKVNYDKPRVGKNHHGYKARKFAQKYIDDGGILDIIQHHDEAYNAWSMGVRRGDWKGAKKRVRKLIELLGDNLELYTVFYRCDNETGDKTNECYNWFVDICTKK